MKTPGSKCIRKFQHLWQVLFEYRTHSIKVCTRCNSRRWVTRRN